MGGFSWPQFDPATSQSPSCGTQSSGVVRGSPDLRPATVRKSVGQTRKREQRDPAAGQPPDEQVELDDVRKEAGHPGSPAEPDRHGADRVTRAHG